MSSSSAVLLTVVFCVGLVSINGQFLQDPCLTKGCGPGKGCRIVAGICESSDCKPEPKCVPGYLAMSSYNPCVVGQPLVDVRGRQIPCFQDQCPQDSYCARPGLFGVGACCYQFKGYFVGNKPGFCRNPPRYFGQCKNNCKSDQECPLIEKCCRSACGFSCQTSFIG